MVGPSARRRVALAAALAVAALVAPASAGAAIFASVDRALTGTTVSAFDTTTPGPLTLNVERGGAVVASAASGPFFSVFLATTVVPGDVIRVTGPASQLVATFDGRPTFDASVCGTTATFSGLRSSAGTGVDFVGARLANGDLYSPGTFVGATVTTLVADTFAGTFERAVTPGYIVSVATSRTVAGGTLFSSLEQALGGCPPVQPQPLPIPIRVAPADTTAPVGRLAARLLTGRLAALLGNRASSTVIVGEPGVRIAQALYLDNGAKLPATVRAAAKRRPRLTLIAHGTAVSRRAGAVRVRLRSTPAGRRLRPSRTVRLAVVTTLRDAAGNVRRLPVRRIAVRR